MIEEVVPDGVVGVEAFDDPPDAVLFPEEELVIARADPERRREFGTVRQCARRALRELGIAPMPLLPGERGMPLWPPGVVGSMTHCAGYRAAAVARDHDVLTVGIDAEPHDALPSGVLSHVARSEEQERLTELTAAGREIHWDRLLFCIKEAVYKAWFPLTRRWLGFADVGVVIDPATAHPAEGAFSAGLLVSGESVAGQPLTGFAGRWLVGGGLVLATAAADVGPSDHSSASSLGV